LEQNLRNMRHEWIVRMKAKGPINIGTRKVFDNINFIQRKKWIEAEARVTAVNKENAEKIAVRKVSDLLNILSFVSDRSIKLEGVEPAETRDSTSPVTVRVINKNEIESWRNMETFNDPELFRGLAYYRKGLNELDPFDAFLAFWAAVEIVSSSGRGRSIASKIVSYARAHSIEISEKDVDDLRGTRNRIAHGAKQYDIDQVDYVAKKIPRVKELARRLLNATINSP
jgi:hypothetical protein